MITTFLDAFIANLGYAEAIDIIINVTQQRNIWIFEAAPVSGKITREIDFVKYFCSEANDFNYFTLKESSKSFRCFRSKTTN